MQLAARPSMRIRFDRGTLVFDQIKATEDRSVLDGAAWDGELSAWRLPASRLSGIRERLSDSNVRPPDISDNIEPVELAAARTKPELRWYQREAIAAWRDHGDRGVIALPTGTGKTITAIGAMLELGVATLIVVPTRVLLDQWARALEQVWSAPIGRLGDGDHRIEAITVSTYASAVAWAPTMGDQFGLVIVDEAHHVGAWCPADVLDMMVAPARLGLTATPPDDGGALERVIGPVIYTLGIAELVGDALAEYDLRTVPIHLTPDEREIYRTARGHFNVAYSRFQRIQPRSSWNEFVKHCARTADGRAALAAWRLSRAVLAYPSAKATTLRGLLARHEGERALVFTSDNATAYKIARELLVLPITCDIGRVERAAMLDRFRAGTAPVLVSSQVLDEGLDVPEADIAIIVGGTASARRHVQRIGRVLRPRVGKRAQVYELATTATTELDQVTRRRRGLSQQMAVQP
jgi:superfamily II DNA or RNA helicase